jgi:DNA-directed RNA polymerase specialized sigma24 family protein
LSRLDREIDEDTFQSDFEALAYPSAPVAGSAAGLNPTSTPANTPIQPDIDALTRFIETRALAKAYRIILSQKFVRRIFDDDRRYNVAHDVAVDTTTVLKNKLASGELTDINNPVQSFGALITTIVLGKHRDREKKGRTVPVGIKKLGPIAVDLFYAVAVKGADLYDAERSALESHPGESAFIRSTVVPAVLRTVQNPSRKADYEYHVPRAAEPDDLDRGSIISGAPRRTPEEELLRNVNISTIRKAVDRLPSPQREIAVAVYLSSDPPSEKELARSLGVKDVGYEKKKIKQELMQRLAEMFNEV